MTKVIWTCVVGRLVLEIFKCLHDNSVLPTCSLSMFLMFLMPDTSGQFHECSFGWMECKSLHSRAPKHLGKASQNTEGRQINPNSFGLGCCIGDTDVSRWRRRPQTYVKTRQKEKVTEQDPDMGGGAVLRRHRGDGLTRRSPLHLVCVLVYLLETTTTTTAATSLCNYSLVLLHSL